MTLDSHFHSSTMAEKGIDIDSLFQDLFNNGFEGGIDIALLPEELKEHQPLLKKYKGKLFSAAGSGPWALDENRSWEEMKTAIEKYGCMAIGETGLDYHWNYGTPEKQKDLFAEQLDYAEKVDKPIIIHTREADKDTLDILNTHCPSRGGILHCFSGTWEMAKELTAKGFFISFSGSLTFKPNKDLRDTLKKLPLDRILLETDSPFLAPVPVRGTVNTPRNMNYIFSMAAELRGMNLSDFSCQILKNFKTFTSVNGNG